MNKILAMECFVRAVENGSFSATARELGMGQPHVSRNIAALEHSLGARLLHRSPRGIVIDDAFHPIADDVPADRLFCLSLPFIMGRHPFIQGITSSHEMGEIVGEALARAVGATLQPAEAA